MTPMDEYDEVAKPPQKIMPLTTKGLYLVPATVDVPDYSRWLNDPEVVKFSELRHREHTAESCREYIASFDQIKNCMWTINLIGADMHIGNITTHHDPHNNVIQMGMLIGEKWAWGRKYGLEAWQAVQKWAKEAGIRRAEAGYMDGNAGMHRILEKCGWSRVAIIPSHFQLTPTEVKAKVIYGANL